MDILTLSLAAKKALAALGVKIAPGEVLTWDGDFDDTEMIMGALYAGKITDKYMDLNSVESFVVKYENGDTKTLTASECIVHADMGVQVLMSVEDEVPYVFSSQSDVEGMMNKGLYFVLAPEFHVEKITFADTIVPIDPKYLPGVCLPVVELSTVITNGAMLTDEESAKLAALAEKRLPVILRFLYSDSTITSVAACSEFEGGSGFMVPFGPLSIQFIIEDGAPCIVAIM